MKNLNPIYMMNLGKTAITGAICRVVGTAIERTPFLYEMKKENELQQIFREIEGSAIIKEVFEEFARGAQTVDGGTVQLNKER